MQGRLRVTDGKGKEQGGNREGKRKENPKDECDTIQFLRKFSINIIADLLDGVQNRNPVRPNGAHRVERAVSGCKNWVGLGGDKRPEMRQGD